MLTPRAAGLIQKAKQAGARGWIVKPFKPSSCSQPSQKLAGTA